MKHLLAILLLVSAFTTVGAQSFEWALYGTDGIGDFNSGMARAYSISANKSGYIDASGKLVIPFRYNVAKAFHGNYAVVKTENGAGIINRKGEYLLPIGNYEVYRFDEMPGAYRVENKTTGKSAFFDGNRFITGFDYDYIDFYGTYPFLSFIKQESSETHTYNVATQTFYDKGEAFLIKDKYVLTYKGKMKVFNLQGEPLDESKFAQSSKGIEVFRNSSTGKYGLRNARTKAVVVPAKYGSSKKWDNPLWIGDVVWLYDSISPKENYIEIDFNADGKQIIKSASGFHISHGRDFICYSDFNSSNPVNYRYFDYNGNENLSLKGTSCYSIASGIYYDSKNHRLTDIEKGTTIENVNLASVNEGMLDYTDTEKKGNFYKNLATGAVFGPYEYTEHFYEGVAVAKKNGKKIIVDKSGREFIFPETIEIEGIRFSEGVIRAYDKSKGIYGYIYNPFGHDGWTYNQKSGWISDYAYKNLINEAQALFDDGKYASAMNKYYRLMMLRPDDNTSFDNYACCLYNLGNYEEALTAVEVALQYWPKDTYAQNLRNDIVAALRKDNGENSDNSIESYSVWDALGNFANALADAFGGEGGQGNAYTPYYGSGNISSQRTSVDTGNYQSQYNNWERLAERHYNSLTNLGYSATSSSGKKHGSAGGRVSSGNYIQMKRSLREAQSNMRRIRREAATNGVTIAQSQWENATVGY